MSQSYFNRAATRADRLAVALGALEDTEAVEMLRDLARVLREPDYRAEWLTEEHLTPVADALVGPDADSEVAMGWDNPGPIHPYRRHRRGSS